MYLICVSGAGHFSSSSPSVPTSLSGDAPIMPTSVVTNPTAVVSTHFSIS